jgi:hypothetical protein
MIVAASATRAHQRGCQPDLFGAKTSTNNLRAPPERKYNPANNIAFATKITTKITINSTAIAACLLVNLSVRI